MTGPYWPLGSRREKKNFGQWPLIRSRGIAASSLGMGVAPSVEEGPFSAAESTGTLVVLEKALASLPVTSVSIGIEWSPLVAGTLLSFTVAE